MSVISLPQKIGQMIMIGFLGTNIEDPSVQEVLSLAQNHRIGGIVLFGENIENYDQLKTLLSPFQELNLFIGIDQEGGRVQRLRKQKGFIETESAHKIAAMELSESPAKYQIMAEQLASLGINLNFGPVVDLHSEHSKVIGKLERSYGSDVDVVTAYAKCFIEAHRKHKVLTALKHFPGHGFAEEDSHMGMVDVTQSYQSQEIQPFAQLIAKHCVDMIMTAHIYNRHVDAQYPATLSAKVIQDILRERLGFGGVVVTDDLHMGAIQNHFEFDQVVIQAINAGNDILLFSCNANAFVGDARFPLHPITLVEQLIGAVVRAVEHNEIPMHRIDQSYQRIMRLKAFDRGEQELRT